MKKITFGIVISTDGNEALREPSKKEKLSE